MNSCRIACFCLFLIFGLGRGKSQDSSWPTYGGDPGGQRFSSATQINKANVSSLREAWRFEIPSAAGASAAEKAVASLEATPVLRGGWLFFSSPFDQVFAVDAANGKRIWSFDPGLHDLEPGSLIVSRGVALWPVDSKFNDRSKPCTTRVFVGTLDARLLALDALTGNRCSDFGDNGTVDLRNGVESQTIGGYGVTSPPTVVGNAVIVGSIVGDNQRIDVQSGVIRAFDATTGHQLWSYEPLPWRKMTRPRSGGGNVWSIMSADPQLGLVFLPTSSPALDHYGVSRPGDNRDADSIVALDARTGRRVWAFQTVHHDLWDYDVPSEPLLLTFNSVPALAVTTKTGQVFVLDRRNGSPLVPVEERSVPSTTVSGEQSWPTQPFSALPPLTSFNSNLQNDSKNSFRRSEHDLGVCKSRFAALDDSGPFTPPSERGTMQLPGNLGGVNWGGAAYDPTTSTLYANVNRYPAAIILLPRYGWRAWWKINRLFILDWPIGIYFFFSILAVSTALRTLRRRAGSKRTPWYKLSLPSLPATIAACSFTLLFAALSFLPQPSGIPHFGHELSNQTGSPYLLERYPILDDSGHPCASPPWGALVALNLQTGNLSFTSPLGTMVPGEHTGALSLGGPIATASGIVFDASTQDANLRGFDSSSGIELWNAALPAPAHATPMTYTLHGKQFVVIAAGGHGGLGEKLANSVVAYALP